MSTKRVVLAALVFTLIYNILFFKVDFGFGWGVLLLLGNFYFFLLRKKDNPDLSLGIASSVTSTVFAFLFAFRSNEVVQAINFLTSVFFILTSVYFYQQPGRLFPRLFQFIILPLTTIKNSFSSLLKSVDKTPAETETTEEGVTDSIIRGVVIAGIIIGVLFLLLQGADPIFGKLTGNFFGSFTERLIVSLVVFTLVFILGLRQLASEKVTGDESVSVPRGKHVELVVVMGSVGTLLLVFILVQLRYLFSTVGERELHELGINSLTYSEYVRKGFFELLLSSVITSAVVLYSLGFLHRFKGSSKTVVQLLSGFLTVETGLLLLSAVKRVVLYADGHGLTRARIIGLIFLVWLALMLIVLLWRVVREMKQVWWFVLTLGITLETLLLVNLINIDGLITDKYKPTVNKEVDYFYLVNLSADAAGSWKESLVASDQVLEQFKSKKPTSAEDYRQIYWARQTLEQLISKRNYLHGKYSLESAPVWQSFNLSEYQAYSLIEKDKAVFGKLDDLLKIANQLEAIIPEIVKQTSILDRSSQPPLTR